MSDLLYFDKSHGDLLRSIDLLLARKGDARVYVAAGKYTPAQVCESFLCEGEKLGLVWDEVSVEGKWEGSTIDATYSIENLEARKNNSRVWTGQWRI
jgi:EEF1A N-terminal glycine/lysine methyltransferase